jgi:DNA-binding winged helix-turn-helix (wHTH) protein/tetratricopeptide (TPR) repeat protein
MGSYIFGPFKVDCESRTLSAGTTDLAVGPKVVETLLALIERAGQVCTAQQLRDRIWPEGFIEPAILPQNIYVLRKVLREHWDAPVIETLRRRGYRFVAAVSFVAAPPASVSTLKPRRSNMRWRWSVLAACILLAMTTLQYSAVPVKGTTASVSPQMASLYAIGRYYWDLRTSTGVFKSIEYFQKMVRQDPRSAIGYSGLADAYYILGDYGYGNRSAQTYYSWQRRDVAKAIALNPNSSAVRTSHAMLLSSVDHNLAAAQEEFTAAIALDPRNATAHQWFGIMLLNEGKTAQARDELESAEQLDPTAPAITRWLAAANYVTRRYGSAIAYYLQALDLSPDDDEAGLMLGLAYEQSHEYTLAMRTYQRFEKQCKCAAALVMEARTLALMGRFGQARVALERAQRASRKNKIEPIDMAAALIALGDRNQAAKWLRTFLRSDQFAKVWVNLDPRLDAVRTDPHFRSFFARSHRGACTLTC